MTDSADNYRSPLASRYASPEMQANFSERRRAGVWRDLWIALAECQRELGLEISAEQIAALKNARDDLDLGRVAELEARLRHDVMAHVHAFGEQAPAARAILHLGATSCFVADGADLVLMRDGLRLLRERLLLVLRRLADFAREHRTLPVLGFTHLQPAQPTTLGKRACLWLQDFLFDLHEVERVLDRLPFRGAKGTTGTQASFLQLFDGDHGKVRALDRLIAERMGFSRSLPVSGQTYPRKWDGLVMNTLAGIGASAAKFGVDLRLLAHRRELEEPCEEQQVGSSAMPHKRNPMRAERMGALSRYLLHLAPNALDTAANQWLERTLDDSANRRLVIPESFLAADAVLVLAGNVAGGMTPWPAVARANLERELPFLATESILMAAVQAGGDRQELHERLRQHASEAAARLKEGQPENDLLERIADDPAFHTVKDRLGGLLEPGRFVGRAPEQVDEFLAEEVEPVLAARPAAPSAPEVRV